jgi:hypothetical protein
MYNDEKETKELIILPREEYGDLSIAMSYT